MQLFHLFAQGIHVALIADDIVGELQASCTVDLLRHDGAHRRLAEAVSPYGALDLKLFRAIDDNHPIQPIAIVTALEQERDDDQGVGRVGGRQSPALWSAPG